MVRLEVFKQHLVYIIVTISGTEAAFICKYDNESKLW